MKGRQKGAKMVGRNGRKRTFLRRKSTRGSHHFLPAGHSRRAALEVRGPAQRRADVGNVVLLAVVVPSRPHAAPGSVATLKRRPQIAFFLFCSQISGSCKAFKALQRLNALNPSLGEPCKVRHMVKRVCLRTFNDMQGQQRRPRGGRGRLTHRRRPPRRSRRGGRGRFVDWPSPR